MKKICFVTGSRAEYCLLKPLIEQVRTRSDFKLQLIVTGMHLSYEFGMTYKEIEKDAVPIDDKIEILLSSDTSVAVSKAMGLAMISFAEAYQRLMPDMIVVLGDRFEIFSAVSAAHISKIRIAHLHGGELTQGAFDDAIRHSITKMSTLHFTSTDEYRKRVIQLGEKPSYVFNVGAIGIDNIKELKLLTKEELEATLGIKFNNRNLLICYHPVTLEDNTSELFFQNLLQVLDGLSNTMLIFTKANADTNGRIINEIIDNYCVRNQSKTRSFVSLGQLNYLSVMQHVDCVVGNSSSGIIETPSFKIGTINIGDRQKGRIKAESIIDCSPTISDIGRSFQKLYSVDFQAKLKNVVNPHGNGAVAKKILNILENYEFNDSDLKKEFYDIPFSLRN